MKEKFRYLTPFLLFLSTLVTCLPINPAWQVLPGRDSGVFMYNGWRILQGEIPYLQLWDHKTPIVYFINALSIVFGGAWGVWAFQILIIFLSSYLLYRILESKFSLNAVLPAMIFWFALILAIIDSGNLTELYALPLQLLAFSLIFFPAAKTKFTPFIVGILIGLLFLTKQSAIGVAAIVGLDLMLRLFDSKWDIKKILTEGLLISLGVIVPVGIALCYFAIQHALPALIDQVFTYNFAYRLYEQTSLRKALLSPLRFINVLFIGLGIVFSLNSVLQKKLLDHKSRSFLLVFSLLVVEFGMTLVARRIPPHYYILMAAPVIYFYTQCFETLYKLPTKKWQQLTITTILIASGVFTYFSTLQKQFTALKSLPDPVISQLISQTSANSSVLMWGNEVSYNVYFHRTAGTRFTFQYPLYMPKYTNDELWNEFCESLIQSQPALFIDTLNKQTPLDNAHLCLKNFISNNYHPSGTGSNKWVIYRHR